MSYNKIYMAEKTLTSELMLKALKELDQILVQPLTLILGGGGAMILAHGYPFATTDIDALPKEIEFHELSQYVEKVAISLNLPGDWLNPHFSSFTYVLPASFQQRLIEVFRGPSLNVQALGKEDMLIMKCFAHRQKDLSHARALIKLKADTELVENHLAYLLDKGVPGADKALEFFDEVID